MAREEWKESEPPRRITALPAFMHSAPASAVTFGRLSKMTPITPSGVRTRSMCSPFGRSHSAMMVPTGSGSSAMARMPSHMPRTRSSLSSSRSRKAPEMPFSRAVAMSMALALRMAARLSQRLSAMAISAACLRSAVAVASTEAALRAARPIAAIVASISSFATALWVFIVLPFRSGRPWAAVPDRRGGSFRCVRQNREPLRSRCS